MKVKEKEVKELTIEEKISSWKSEHKKVYMSIINGKEYIWRRIKRKEYADVMAVKDGDDIDERIYNRQVAIVKLVVLNVTEDELIADLEDLVGLAPSIAEEVLEKSGFNISTTVEL